MLWLRAWTQFKRLIDKTAVGGREVQRHFARQFAAQMHFDRQRSARSQLRVSRFDLEDFCLCCWRDIRKWGDRSQNRRTELLRAKDRVQAKCDNDSKQCVESSKQRPLVDGVIDIQFRECDSRTLFHCRQNRWRNLAASLLEVDQVQQAAVKL